ncbi:MAG: T9SS type A sorting domain-containing protein [Ignavibacteriaceae bacterium]|nr:T9SS type A sorting domain-containing protein [Ignavibacteriaceae bacterium]
MKKLFSLLIIALFVTSPILAQGVMLWEKTNADYSWITNDNTMRGLTYNEEMGHVLACSRTTAANIYILDKATGDSLGTLDMTGVAGGTYPINIIKSTPDGAIYGVNLTTSGAGLKIYRWANESAAPTVAFSGDLTGRFGDVMAVSGNGASTVIYVSGSSNTLIQLFTTVDGSVYTAASTITVAAGAARGGIAPVSSGVSSELWINGAGTSIMHIDAAGTVLNTVDGGVISSGWQNVAYNMGSNGRKVIAVVGKNDGTLGSTVQVFDVSNSEVYPTRYGEFKLTIPYVTNANATSDMSIVDNGNGTFTFYCGFTNNGVAAFKSNMVYISEAREDLNNDFQPDRFHDTLTIKAVCISPNFQTLHRSYYVWDGTGGIATFKGGLLSPDLHFGDYFQATGFIDFYNGLTEFTPLTDSSLTVISDSNFAMIPQPTVLTLAQFKANAEYYEGRLVAFANLSKASGTWPAAAASATIKVTDGVDTMDYRIDSDTDLDDQPEPVWPKDLIALGSQFTSAAPYNTGYQLMPRYYATDILPPYTVPVELSSFSANVNNGTVVLSWQTATETNNSGFAVEKSNDNISFSKIAFVNGNGTTTEKHNYSYIDNGVSGTVYYRLKQIDFDGTFAYSSTVEVSVETPASYGLAQNYPNPFNPSTTINFTLPVNAKVKVTIFNILGKEISALVNQDLTSGSHNFNVNLKDISSGVYFYTIEAKGIDGSLFTNTKKMTLLK